MPAHLPPPQKKTNAQQNLGSHFFPRVQGRVLHPFHHLCSSVPCGVSAREVLNEHLGSAKHHRWSKCRYVLLVVPLHVAPLSCVGETALFPGKIVHKVRAVHPRHFSKVNHCVHPEVPPGILIQLLWDPPPFSKEMPVP